ncbi:MAG: hypothetical protein B9S30_06750 [Verrucomicrobiia bacterium Tous-C5FEB]|nr:MAG: hypothetical protein B9S30_06750 [Verrucomicrobiae bacterium Tous-C5FEB]
MAGNWKKRGESDEVNFWPAFADMAAATCMMLTIIWLAGAWELSSSKDQVSKLHAEIARLKKLVGKESELVEIIKSLEYELAAQKNETKRLQIALLSSEQDRLELESQLKKLREERPNIEPPNIVLKQDESFIFDSLQAVVPEDFDKLFKEKKRQEVIDALNSPSNIEVIEIIGHTDNKEVGGTSNVDTTLEAVYAGTKNVSSLKFGSNCELGLARAIAVKNMLKEFLKTLKVGEGELTEAGKNRMKNIEYRTYSAAQLFPTDPLLPGRSEDRRIEIRFTRLRKTTED